jgi:hypothetical protein
VVFSEEHGSPILLERGFGLSQAEHSMLIKTLRDKASVRRTRRFKDHGIR